MIDSISFREKREIPRPMIFALGSTIETTSDLAKEPLARTTPDASKLAPL